MGASENLDHFDIDADLIDLCIDGQLGRVTYSPVRARASGKGQPSWGQGRRDTHWRQLILLRAAAFNPPGFGQGVFICADQNGPWSAQLRAYVIDRDADVRQISRWKSTPRDPRL